MNYRKKQSTALLAFVFLMLLSSYSIDAQTTTNIYWDFTDGATPASGVVAGLSTPTLTSSAATLSFNNTSASGTSGNDYTTAAGFAASGGNNAAVTAQSGAFDIATSTYFAFSLSLSLAAGTAYNISDISFGSRQTGTGPTNLFLYESTDGSNFSSLGSILAVTNDSIWKAEDFSGISISLLDDSSTTYFRIYGSNGTGSGTGNWRVDDLAVTLAPVPEPSTVVLASVGGLAGGFVLFRRRCQTQKV